MAQSVERKARAQAKATKGPRVKPNEKCPCKSGKKFKKCCRKVTK